MAVVFEDMIPPGVEDEDFDVIAYLNERMNRFAFILKVPDETFDEWFAKQQAWWEAHFERLSEAWRNASSPAARLLTEQRIAFARAFMARLKKAGHLLACADHGIQGVELTEIREAIGMEYCEENEIIASDVFGALASLGLYDGADALSWTHVCEKCMEKTMKRVVVAKMQEGVA